MKKGKRHNIKGTCKRTSWFVQPKQVVSFAVAFFLAFSLFPAFPLSAFAASSTDSSSTSALSVSSNTSTSGSSGNTTSSGSTTQGSTNSASANSTSSSASSSGSATISHIQIGTEPLNLIQNGNYQATSTTATISTFATTAGVNYPSATQHAKIKARFNTALMNVEASYYSGTSDWCIINVADIKAPCGTNATNYAKSLVEETVNSNPDLFYVGASYGAGTTTSGGTVILNQILVRYYYAPSTIKNTMKPKYESAMQSMLSWVNASKSYKSSTDAEKAKAVHDWLVRNAKYNWNAYLKGSPQKLGSWTPWSAYGALVTSSGTTADGKSGKYSSPVCEGYSLAFIAAMNRLGIQSTFVTNAGHGWNRVRLKVGSSYDWYNLDITWDDPLKTSDKYSDGGYSTTPSTRYFLKSDSYFKTKLGESASSGQHVKWTPAGTAGNNTTFDSASWTTTSASSTSAGGVYPLSSNSHAVNSISVSPTSVGLELDSSRTITLNASGTNVIKGMAKWTSSNPSVVAVSSNGVVTSGSKTGTATITVSLGGKTAKLTVTVSSKPNVANAKVSVASGQKLTYTEGVARRPNLNVVLNGQTLKAGADYTISWPSDTINPGTKTVTITGKGNYTGTTTFNYTVTHTLSTTSIAKTGTGYNSSTSTLTTTYTGSAQKKLPTLTFKGSLNKSIVLKEGTDFTVTWPSDVTNAGTKTVVIRGKGAWTGTFTYKLIINAQSVSSASITYDTVKRYSGKAVTQTPLIKANGIVIENSNYTLSYRNNVNTGTAYMTVTGKGNLSGSVVKTFTIKKQNPSWTRLWGSNALNTMQAITKRFGTAKIAVVATNADFKDSLAAAGLAGALNAPLLTTSKGSLSAQTKSELNRMGVTTVYVVGSANDVSANTFNQIKALSKVKSVQRITGSSASAKAIACAKKQGTNRSNTVIIATQKSFKDALSISSYAYASKSPILYVESNLTLSSATISYIKSAGFTNAIIVGGPVAIPNSVLSQLNSAGISSAKITRLAGSNAYSTSRIIAEWTMGKLKSTPSSKFYQYTSIKFQPTLTMTINNVGISRGDNWKDALAGAALCGKNRSVILLVDKSNTSNTTVISGNKYDILYGYVFGGTAAVSADTYTKIVNASK